MYENSVTEQDWEGETRLWGMMFTLPKDESKGRKWTHNKAMNVAAPTMQAAIDKVMKVHPDAFIMQCNHRGALTVLPKA